MKINQTVDIGTDIASFFLFHPDDLAHRKNDPLDWHGYDFACCKEFEAGNLVAFRTGSDGGYQLRLTGGDLTDAERDKQTGSWEWGLTVRCGKILVDNGDFLPSEEARPIKNAPQNHWVEVPIGDYRVTVYPIAREDETLPDYVIRFAPVDAPLRLALSPVPPEMPPRKSEPPHAGLGISADDLYQENNAPLDPTYPLLAAEGKYVLPGGSLSVPVSDELLDAVQADDPALTKAGGDIYVVLVPSENVPELGTLSWVNGSSQMTGEAGNIRLQGQRLVRVTETKAGKPLPIAHVEPVTRQNAPLSAAPFKALQAAFAAYAEKHTSGKNKIAAFDAECVAAMTNGAALTTRLLEIVEMPAKTRFRLHEAADTERCDELMALLDAAPDKK